MVDPTDKQLGSLPQWAQQHIVSLERELKGMRALLKEATNGGSMGEFSYVDVRTYDQYQTRFKLPQYSMLSAFAEEGEATIEFRESSGLGLPGRWLEIRARNRSLIATPVASNLIAVRCADR